MRYLLPILAHLIVLPITLANLALDALDAIADDVDARADAALVLTVLLLLAGWACGVFEE